MNENWKLVDEAGKEIFSGHSFDRHEERVTVTGITPPKSENSSGRVHVVTAHHKSGKRYPGSYFPHVYRFKIVPR